MTARRDVWQCATVNGVCMEGVEHISYSSLQTEYDLVDIKTMSRQVGVHYLCLLSSSKVLAAYMYLSICEYIYSSLCTYMNPYVL